MRTEELNRPKKLIRQALAELESSLYDSDSVKYAYMQLDTIASAFRDLYDDLFTEDDEESPNEVFEKLVTRGLDKAAPGLASSLEKIASRKWYDDKRESEQAVIDEAEQLREDLLALLEEFLDSRGPRSASLPLFPDDAGDPEGEEAEEKGAS